MPAFSKASKPAINKKVEEMINLQQSNMEGGDTEMGEATEGEAFEGGGSKAGIRCARCTRKGHMAAKNFKCPIQKMPRQVAHPVGYAMHAAADPHGGGGG